MNTAVDITLLAVLGLLVVAIILLLVFIIKGIGKGEM